MFLHMTVHVCAYVCVVHMCTQKYQFVYASLQMQSGVSVSPSGSVTAELVEHNYVIGYFVLKKKNPSNPYIYIYIYVCVCVCVCVCVRERKTERERVCVYVCAHARSYFNIKASCAS